MASNFSNLALSDRFRASPLGSTSRLSTGPGTPQFNQAMSGRRGLERDYNSALRALRRESRDRSGGARGKANAARAAVDLVNLREQALSRGISPGGIRRYEDRVASDIEEINNLQDQTRQSQVNADRMGGLSNPNATASPPAPATSAPQTQLGRFAQTALNKVRPAFEDAATDPGSAQSANEFFRPGMDRALGRARTRQEVDELRTVAGQGGISAADFDRRADWWKKRRPLQR